MGKNQAGLWSNHKRRELGVVQTEDWIFNTLLFAFSKPRKTESNRPRSENAARRHRLGATSTSWQNSSCRNLCLFTFGHYRRISGSYHNLFNYYLSTATAFKSVRPRLRRPCVHGKSEGVEVAAHQFEAQTGAIGFIPQVLELARILLQIVEFPMLVAVIDNNLVAPVPVHGGEAALVLRSARRVRIEGAVVLAADKVAVPVQRSVPAQERQQ